MRIVLAALALCLLNISAALADCGVFPTYNSLVDSAGVVIEQPSHVNMNTLIVDVENFKSSNPRQELQLMVENAQYETAMSFIGQINMAQALYEWRGLEAAMTRLHSERFIGLTEGQSSFLESYCAAREEGSQPGVGLYDERIGLAIAAFSTILCTVLLGSVFVTRRRFPRNY